MDLQWRGYGDQAREGWCGGFHVGQVLRRRRGWRGFVRWVPVDEVDYPTAEGAQAVVEAAVAGEPDPVAVRPPKRWRRVPNEPE